jgi:hypothetical protein
LLRVLSNYERLYIETYTLKVMLSTSENPTIRDTWEATLQEVLQMPEVAASLDELHAVFDVLRAQVLAAIDAEVALHLLKSIPSLGKPN